MRYVAELACGALCAASACANAQPQDLHNACPIAAVTAPVRYIRLHQIPTAAPPGDISHTIVTPGGMVLDTPKMVAATDELTIVAREQDVLCFGLRTVARDRHKCELTGVARIASHSSAYVFQDNDATVRFTFVGDDEVIVEPVGTGYRSRCEPSGQIERATYSLHGASD